VWIGTRRGEAEPRRFIDDCQPVVEIDERHLQLSVFSSQFPKKELKPENYFSKASTFGNTASAGPWIARSTSLEAGVASGLISTVNAP